MLSSSSAFGKCDVSHGHSCYQKLGLEQSHGMEPLGASEVTEVEAGQEPQTMNYFRPTAKLSLTYMVSKGLIQCRVSFASHVGSLSCHFWASTVDIV